MKKPIYKKWWFWVIIVVVLIGIGAALGGSKEDDKENSQEKTPQDTVGDVSPQKGKEQKEEEEKKEEQKEESREEEDNGKYTDGTYKVGTDIPAGEYVVFADGVLGLGYMEVASDSTGDLGSLITNSSVKGNDIITISEGQYFKLQSAYAVPFEEAEVDITQEGAFKVGVHLSAGEYKIVLNEDSSLELGYVEVSTDSTGQLGSIRTNEAITGDTYITVNDGEYLTLSGCHIQQ